MKLTNEYANLFDAKVYEDTPKSVFAAIAMSFALRLNEDNFERAMSEIITEWQILNMTGLVPQSVPPYMSKLIVEIVEDDNE